MEIRKCEIEVMIVMAQYRWRAKKREKARVSLKASQDGGRRRVRPVEPRRRCVITRGPGTGWIFNSRSEWRATKERERIPRVRGNKSMYNN